MNITPLINNFSNYRNINKSNIIKTNSTLKLNTLKADTVSFKRKDPMESLLKLPDNAFPSEGLREYLVSGLQDSNEQKGIFVLHKEYYSKLMACETLAQAKRLYPEFKDVVDAAKFKGTKMNRQSLLKRIEAGEIPNLTLENASLELLKRYWAQFYTLSDKEKYFNFDPESTSRLLKQLNISMKPKYYKFLLHQKHADSEAKNWQDSKYRQEHLVNWTPEKRKAQSERAQQYWLDSTYRQAQSDSWDENRRLKTSQTAKNNWQNPVIKEKMLEGARKPWKDAATKERLVASIRKRTSSPEFSKEMSRLAKARWKDPKYQQAQAESWTESRRKQLSEKSRERWKDPKFRQKIAEYYTPEKRKEISNRIKELWQNPAYRELQLARWDDEKRQEQAQKLYNLLWATDETRAMMAIVYEASRQAWQMFPECSLAYEMVAKNYPYMKTIRMKESTGKKLTNNEQKYRNIYHKTCNDLFPEIPKLIGEAQKEILKQWGFYDTQTGQFLELLNFLGINEI